jgi:hypothetical protein
VGTVRLTKDVHGLSMRGPRRRKLTYGEAAR